MSDDLDQEYFYRLDKNNDVLGDLIKNGETSGEKFNDCCAFLQNDPPKDAYMELYMRISNSKGDDEQAIIDDFKMLNRTEKKTLLSIFEFLVKKGEFLSNSDWEI